MSHNPSSRELKSTYAKFYTKPAAIKTKTKLAEAGIDNEKIVVEAKSFKPRLQIKNTQAITNLKTGAIAGGVLGALIGLFISLTITNFANIGLEAFKNFQAIHYLSPVIGAVIGASGISLILGLSGVTVPKTNSALDASLSKSYLLAVEGTPEEINLAQEIIEQQEGLIKEK